MDRGGRRVRGYPPIGADLMVPGDRRRWGTFSFVLAFIGLLALLGVAAFILVFIFRSQYIRTITNVPPTGGEVTLIGGAFITVVPNALASTITLNSDGVGTINGLNPINNNIDIAAGTGIGVANDAGTATITISNLGVLTINSAPPQSGNIDILGGTGITVNTNVGTGEITIVNDGVLTVNSAPPQGGNIDILAGTAIGVSTNVGTGEITINNEGVTSFATGFGLDTNTGPTGAVDVYHRLSERTQLAAIDPLGPQVSYAHDFGFITPIDENTWRMGVAVGFFPFLLPGVVPGEGGLGNAVISWVVPEIGQYNIQADCEIFPSAIGDLDHQSVTMAINVGASTVDPTVSGYIPPGGINTIDLSSGTGVGPDFPSRVMVSASVHAGCVGCPVLVGDALTLHVRQDHKTEGAAVTLAVACRIQVSQSKQGV